MHHNITYIKKNGGSWMSVHVPTLHTTHSQQNYEHKRINWGRGGVGGGGIRHVERTQVLQTDG